MSWDTESSTYDPDAFYTRSTDQKGHGELIHIKLPSYMHGMLAELVEDHNLPSYRTQADVVRDALHHRFHYLNEHLPNTEATRRLEPLAVLHRIQTATFRYHEELTAITQLIQDAQKAFQDGLAAGDYNQLRQLLTTVEQEATSLREPFRSQLLEWIQQKRGQFPKGAGK